LVRLRLAMFAAHTNRRLLRDPQEVRHKNPTLGHDRVWRYNAYKKYFSRR